MLPSLKNWQKPDKRELQLRRSSAQPMLKCLGSNLLWPSRSCQAHAKDGVLRRLLARSCLEAESLHRMQVWHAGVLAWLPANILHGFVLLLLLDF